MEWQRLFSGFDLDGSGKLDFRELQKAIQQIGYRFSPEILNKLIHIYDSDKSGTFTLDEFIQIFCELHIVTAEFKKYDVQGRGVAQITYEQFLSGAFALKR